MNQVNISSIQPVGDCGMYKAYITIDNHQHAISVIGTTLTECVERAHTILCAFRKLNWLVKNYYKEESK